VAQEERSKARLRLLRADVEASLSGMNMPATASRTDTLVAIGPPGAGKSTALGKLAARDSRWAFTPTDILEQQSGRLKRYLLRAFVEGDHSVTLAFQVDALAVRHIQYLSAPPASLVDESIDSTLGYSTALWLLGWLDDDEFQTFYLAYLMYASVEPMPALTVVFTCDPHELQRRRTARNRADDPRYSDTYVRATVDGFTEVATQLASRRSVALLDTTDLSLEETVDSLAAVRKQK
jgi:thymidylate kinase